MKNKYPFILLVLYLFLFNLADQANGQVIVKGEKHISSRIAVFIKPVQGHQMRSLVMSAGRSVLDTLNHCGRFMPFDQNKINGALQRSLKSGMKDVYKRAAQNLNADLYIIVSIDRLLALTYGKLTIVPLSDKYSRLKKTIHIQSKIPTNIPHKMARILADLHSDIPIKATVLRKRGNLRTISAGQWHRLKSGRYNTEEGQSISVVQTGRFQSLAKIPNELIKKKSFYIETYPDVSDYVEDIDKKIFRNIMQKHSIGSKILKGDDPEKRIISGILVINTGANVCIPGFGSYLATEYMGVGGKSPSVAGIFLSAGLVVTHFTLTEILTEFNTNFFPWNQDSDKTNGMNNLHIFLWATLPITFTASYLDQLAHQYSEYRVLPPFFSTRDEAAAVFSLLIPGGGLFYKGHRFLGWSYYSVEMFLAGYGFYFLESKNRSTFAFVTLGIVKLIEMIHAYFVRPNYDFFNYEMEEGVRIEGVSMGLYSPDGLEHVYSMSAMWRF